MKQISLFETFIKPVKVLALTPVNINPHFVGSLLIVVALTGLTGAIPTEAQAPTEAETAEHDNGFVTEADRAAALEKLAAEIKQISYDNEQIEWLARLIYSETKRSAEMPYIAWVVRNRVDIGHRSYDAAAGVNNYKGAALANSQFSGMHPHLDHNAYKNLAMNYGVVGVPAWDEAVRVAREVYYADSSERLLAQNVTHFYSPFISPPAWANPNKLAYRFEGRFHFYTL